MEIADEEWALIRSCLDDRVELMENWGEDTEEIRETIESLDERRKEATDGA